MATIRKVTSNEIARSVGGRLTGDQTTIIQDVTHDSRQAKGGVLFVAIKGLTMDGHRFVPQVMANSAAGVISEQEPPSGFEGVWIKVEDARRAMALAAAEVHG